jgi:hypothetical protein
MENSSYRLPNIRYVDHKSFILTDGRAYRHLFTWTYVPSLEDFKILFEYCHKMMLNEDLRIIPKRKRKKKISDEKRERDLLDELLEITLDDIVQNDEGEIIEIPFIKPLSTNTLITTLPKRKTRSDAGKPRGNEKTIKPSEDVIYDAIVDSPLEKKSEDIYDAIIEDLPLKKTRKKRSDAGKPRGKYNIVHEDFSLKPKRKTRSDAGKLRGKNSKKRSDAGKPRGKSNNV